jgi:hypothetical protein
MSFPVHVAKAQCQGTDLLSDNFSLTVHPGDRMIAQALRFHQQIADRA